MKISSIQPVKLPKVDAATDNDKVAQDRMLVTRWQLLSGERGIK